MIHVTGINSLTHPLTYLLTQLFTQSLTYLLTRSLLNHSNESNRIIHNVAQLAHAIAQGKLGSGFDVAAAVYGNQLYRRFNADNFKNVMNNDMSKHADVLYEHVMNAQLWTQTIESMVSICILFHTSSFTYTLFPSLYLE